MGIRSDTLPVELREMAKHGDREEDGRETHPIHEEFHRTEYMGTGRIIIESLLKGLCHARCKCDSMLDWYHYLGLSPE